MPNETYYDRLVKERDDLKEKVDKLFKMLNAYFEGTLDFTPNCTYNLLHEQYIYMKRYLDILDYRVEYEKSAAST